MHVPYKYYAHVHYNEKGEIEFASVKTEKHRKYAYTVYEEEKKTETGQTVTERTRVNVPRVILTKRQTQALIERGVREAGISRTWLAAKFSDSFPRK